jgi:hypothetical protein
MTLPNLELKFTKMTEKKLDNSNINTNTINNNIILSDPLDRQAMLAGDKIKEPVIQKSSCTSSRPLASSDSLSRACTPDNIKQFKEALILILISYFKNNVILLNNLVELSDKIVTKIDDLKLLISLLIEEPITAINIVVEEITVKNCCGEICKRLPRYRAIDDIIINNKQSFRISHNQYYIQLQTEFNISLDYILL